MRMAIINTQHLAFVSLFLLGLSSAYSQVNEPQKAKADGAAGSDAEVIPGQKDYLVFTNKEYASYPEDLSDYEILVADIYVPGSKNYQKLQNKLIETMKEKYPYGFKCVNYSELYTKSAKKHKYVLLPVNTVYTIHSTGTNSVGVTSTSTSAQSYVFYVIKDLHTYDVYWGPDPEKIKRMKMNYSDLSKPLGYYIKQYNNYIQERR